MRKSIKIAGIVVIGPTALLLASTLLPVSLPKCDDAKSIKLLKEQIEKTNIEADLSFDEIQDLGDSQWGGNDCRTFIKIKNTKWPVVYNIFWENKKEKLFRVTIRDIGGL